MKKITLLTVLFMVFFIKGNAQFGCDQAVVITNGFTQSAITTPGNGGMEDWADLPVGTSISEYYWADDVYLFQYTAGALDESVSMTTLSRSGWNGIGIFSSCTGSSFSGHLASVGSTGANATKTVTATVAAGQTVYIAIGQWGSPYNLDFDVVSFTAEAIVLPPNCDATLTSPANGATDAILTGVLTWSAATGSPTGYTLKVGTTTGGTEVGNFVLGNVTTYNIPGLLEGDTTYYVSIVPVNGNGEAVDCTEYSFTTGPAPVEGSLCENALIVDALPFTTTDNTVNYADVYYEGSPGANGCGSTSSYLNGNDVVYAYTATFTGSVKILLTPEAGNTWGGLFVYGSCSNIGVSCLGGVATSAATPKMIEEFPVTTGETYYIVISTYASPQTIAYTLDITENTCTNGTATYEVVSDCANGEQFLVNVNVSSLGTAASMTIYDDQGSDNQTITEAGTYVFGPYPNATPVIFTTINDLDESCSLTSPALVQAVCPPNCEDAEIINACDEEITAEFIAGPGAWSVSACGYSTPGVEFMYSFTPEETGAYVLEVVSATGGYVDYFWKAASGTCDTTGWNCIDDLNGPATRAIGTLEAGVEYLFLLDNEGTGARTHTFKIQCLPTCTNGTSTYTIVSDCANGEQFFINVDVTSLGTAESVTISDDYGTDPQTATAPGIFTFGPYENTTPVIINLYNDQDETCFWSSTALTQNVCPPNCEDAEVIAACGDEVTADFAAGAGAWNVSACGYSTPGIEFMYSFTPEETGDYVLEVLNGTGYVDYFWKAASGTCDTTGWNCIDDLSGSATTRAIGTLEAGVEYLFLLDNEGITARTHTFTIQCLPTCTNGTSTYAVVSDCANGEQFFIDVNVTSLGTAESVTINDDYGSNPQTVTAPGVSTFGPYPNNTPVIFTLNNDQDETCFWSSTTLNQVACPPANDECAGAIMLTPGGDFDAYALETSNLGATRNPADHDPTTVTSTCDTFNFLVNGKDVWYTVIAPASGTLTIETASNGDEALTDTSIYIYTGTCDALVYKVCNGDIGYPNFFSKVELTGLTPGEVVTARVFGYSGSAGSFSISAYDASLSNAQYSNADFKVYPNPVKNVLNFSYAQNITNVEIFNMLGQQVLAKSVNATLGQADMSNLTSGTYLVKITADNQVKTIKVVKE